MYRYDAFDRELVRARIRQFADQIRRRLEGRLDEATFRRLRLLNGLYLQLHGYMLRVPIPYGVMRADQLRALAEVAERFDRGYVHLTTRQNVQFHWIRLVDVPAILERLAEVELTPIQACSNSIRNITSDPFAGIAPDEEVDPRPWCELLRQFLTLDPEFSFLPRKFKMAVIGARRDRAMIRAHDVGIRLWRQEDGVRAEVVVGGGLGRTPMLGQVLRADLPAAELLPYLRAILRTYNRHGRRDHLYKSRLKILVHALGIDRFRAEVEAEYERGRDPELVALGQAELARIAAHFTAPSHPLEPAAEEHSLAAARARDPALDRFVATNVLRHRQPGHRAVVVTPKRPGAVPGDLTAAQLRQLADLAERFSFGEIRTTHAQDLVLPYVRAGAVAALWRELAAAGLAEVNHGRATDLVACPGLDYCSLATARSIPVAQELARELARAGLDEALGELTIRISGCINACGHHHVGHIGILGLEKRGAEAYQLMLGGSDADDASLGTVIAPALARREIVPAVLRILRFYLARRHHANERFLDFVRRVGVRTLREALHAPAAT